MRNGPNLWWSNFSNSLVVLICCHWSQTWSLTLKLGCFFRCSSTFSLYCLCIFSKLDRSWAQTFVNHMAWSSIVGFLTLFKHWMSNLGCKPWFPFFKMFVDLMNALCCYRQTLLWLKVLTNYLNDNLLCIVNIIPILDWLVLFAHSSRGGKLMTTSPSYLKGQRVTFEI